MARVRPIVLCRFVMVLCGAGASGRMSAQDTVPQRVCRPTSPPQCVPALPKTDPLTQMRGAVPEQGQPYLESMVDTPVAEVPGTARPVYPPVLKSARVSGDVLARFVVDTAGLVEPGTFKVLRTTHSGFSDAVADAVPRMRFVPARAKGHKVRQLVMQPFSFRVTGDTTPPLRAPMPQVLAERPGPLNPVGPDLAQGTVPGWVLGQTVTIDSGNGSPPRVTTQRFVGSGTKVRMESTIPSGRMAGQPTVLIIDADAGTMVGLTAATRTAIISKRPPLPTFARPVVTNLTSSTDTLGPGPEMLGRPTTHARLRMHSTLTQTFAGMTCSRDNDSESEVWSVADPTVARIEREVARVIALVSPGGVASPSPRRDTASVLRAAMIQRRVGTDGKPVVVTTTTTVTEYREGPVDATLLTVPAGYTVQDLTRAPLPNMPNLESIMAQAQARAFWMLYDSTATLPDGKKACVRAGGR